MSEVDVRRRWSGGDACHGLWSLLAGVVTADVLARTGADFVVVDLQHGAVAEVDLPGLTAAIRGAGSVPLVRTRSPLFADIGRPLDLGACGVIVPNIRDAEHAREVVGVSWSNGTSNAVEGTFSKESPTTVTSEVEIAGEYLVKHHFHPSPSPNLIQIDVEVFHIGDGAKPTDVYYRRVFDWDIPDDVFTEYSTMGSNGNASFVAHASDDGFNDPSPASPRTQIAASGLFEDVGPRDNGGQVEISLGSFENTNYKEFTLYYGASRSEAGALAAVNSVPSQIYSLGQHDPSTGEPVTAIFAVDGSNLTGASASRATSDQLTIASEDVVTRGRRGAQKKPKKGPPR